MPVLCVGCHVNGRHTTLLAVACVVTLAGCGFITGEESLSVTASPATAGDGAVSETGYEELNVTAQTVTRNVTVAGQTREVAVTNQLARYERETDLGALGSRPAGVFVTYTSPEVEVANESFNPIADLSEREVLTRANQEYAAVSVGERVGSRTVSTLGQSTAVEKFDGTATLAGSEVDVSVHATKFRHEGDFVVAIGVYPRENGDAERIVTLLESLEHGGE